MASKLDFIQAWTIPEYICDALVDYYKANVELQVVGHVFDTKAEAGVDKNVKDSSEVIINPRNLDQPFSDYHTELQKCLNEYAKIFPMVNNLNSFSIVEPYNIQHYPKGGGYKIEHFERDGSFNSTIKRCLVFMTYLNDVEKGGTFFPYQQRLVKAIKGKTLIFPSDWTHTHVGQISETQEKTIVTGWYSYMWDY